MAIEFYKIRERVMDEWYAEQSPVLRGTVDSGDTDTIVDAAVAISGGAANQYDYGYIKIRSTTDNLAPQGETRSIDQGGFTASSGTFETAAFSAAVGAGDTFEVHPTYHPDSLDQSANKLLRGLHMPTIFPLSLDLQGSDDNDMEASGVTGWTGGTATPTKSTTAYNGAQSITLTGSGALDYITAGNFPVIAGKTYYTAVMNQVDSGDSARLRMFDSTNSATIQDSGDSTQEAWVEMLMQWTAPSGCRQAQVRMMSVGSGDIARWDDYQVWSNEGHVYPLPSWLTRKNQLLGVYAWPEGEGLPVEDTFTSDEMNSRQIRYSWERADVRGNTKLYIWVPGIGQQRPFIRASKPLAEVAFDYGTAGVGAGSLGSPANSIPLSSTEADGLVMGILADLHRKAARRYVGEERTKHEREARDLEKNYERVCGHLFPERREQQYRSNRVGVSL